MDAILRDLKPFRFCNPLRIDVMDFLLLLVEKTPVFATAIATLVAYQFLIPKNKGSVDKTAAAKKIILWGIAAIAVPLVVMIASTFVCSWEDAYWRGYDLSAPSLREQLETYIHKDEGDCDEIIESGKYAPTFGWVEMSFLIGDLLNQAFLHLDKYNKDNIAEGYNKGNDWFEAFLGKDSMVYTSGIFKNGNESLREAQIHKLDYVADAIELKQGETVLDIGCGWGVLSKHFAEEYGASVTGVTLSSEQLDYASKMNEKNKNVNIVLQDAMHLPKRTDVLPASGQFDKIVSLEMAEHVGIRRYQEFLSIVHSLLKDDGVFYFQVAGLRRAWRYEDLVWGLFMGQWIFPGADASCHLGWVSQQLEQAGFEIQRVSNLGNHYSKTIAFWLANWRANREEMIKAYGEVSYRRWEIFLAWSVRVARQGSSTVFMFTITKAGQEQRRIQSQAHLAP